MESFCRSYPLLSLGLLVLSIFLVVSLRKWYLNTLLSVGKEPLPKDNPDECSPLEAVQTLLKQRELEIVRLETLLEQHKQCLVIRTSLEEKLSEAQSHLHAVTLEQTKKRIEAESQAEAAKKKLEWFLMQEEKLENKFQHLAQTCLEQTTGRSLQSHETQLKQTLTPFREQLQRLQSSIETRFEQQAKETHTLTYELQRLQNLNLQLSQEAENLTKALKGDRKLQGNWGELLLARALEYAGLREGFEFKLQLNMPGGDEQSKIQPDAVVFLPKGRSVIIDAKVSLSAYERYCSSEEEEPRKRALQEHIAAIKRHIKSLSKKRYPDAPALNSLDYVLMFMPLEPAFSLAVQHAPEILKEAHSQQVMIVGPSSLLVALKTIQNLWQLEHQTTNARAIAKRATALYDKLRLLIESLESIGNAIDKSKQEYFQAMNRLCRGKGNLLQQIDQFQKLGVEVKKKIVEPEGVEEEALFEKEVEGDQADQVPLSCPSLLEDG